MKGLKGIVSVILVAALILSGLSGLGNGIKKRNTYYHYLTIAQESMEKGLYEQAIENYKKFLSYKQDKEVYQKIMEAYELFYQEEASAYVRRCYIEDMALAASAFPQNAEYWKKQIELYLEEQNDSKAYTAAKEAVNSRVKDEEIQKIYEELLYKVKTDYQLYTEFKTCLNGYITVFDGNLWKVIDNKGSDITGMYQFAGLINDEGKGIYVNDIDTRLLDQKEVSRARFDFTVEDAGCYSDSLECVPVKIKGRWRYLKMDGTFLPGEYEEAGSFYQNTAAVKENNSWYLIDEKGERLSSQTYEDIKLDLYGCHIQGKVILAKEKGKYHLYDTEFKQIGDFSCDDIDICIDNNLIAFKQGELWGYVNTKGEIIVEPLYAGAKSFSNGMAAVSNKSGMWGFINREYQVVIDCRYLDAYYYTSDETCLVSTQKGSYQIQKYVFE